MEGRVKVGDTLRKYTVEKLIGQGGHGKVFRCIETGTSKNVAIKEIQKEAFPSAEIVKKMLEDVKGENIIELIETFEEGNCVYLVYEFCNDGDLSDYMKSHGGKLDEKKAQLIMAQIVAGYDIIYKRNIIHGGIKPGNFLVTYKNPQAKQDDLPTIKMADFGISSKTLIGTPAYSAPELLKGSTHFDYKVDIWAIGITLYYLLHNCLPFKGDMIQVLNGFEVGIYQTRMDISIFCLDFIDKCLQYEISQRMSFDNLKNHPFITGKNANWKETENNKINAAYTSIGIEIQQNIKLQLNLFSNIGQPTESCQCKTKTALLECGHFICTDCAAKISRDIKTKNIKEENAKCPQCSAKFKLSKLSLKCC